MVCLPGKGTVHFSTNCMKIINIGESTPLEVFLIGCELTTSNFQPKRSSFERRQPEQEKQQGMRMLTVAILKIRVRSESGAAHRRIGHAGAACVPASDFRYSYDPCHTAGGVRGLQIVLRDPDEARSMPTSLYSRFDNFHFLSSFPIWWSG